MAKLYIKNTDGTFAPHSSIAVTKLDVVQSKGNSLTSAMSQKAVTDELATKQNALTDTDGGYGQRVAKLEKEGIASQEKLSELGEKIGGINTTTEEFTIQPSRAKIFFDGLTIKQGDAFSIKINGAANGRLIISANNYSIRLQDNAETNTEYNFIASADISTIELGNYTSGDVSLAMTLLLSGIESDIEKIKSELDSKVNKENGKGLSTNDFTDIYKSRVDESGQRVVPFYLEQDITFTASGQTKICFDNLNLKGGEYFLKFRIESNDAVWSRLALFANSNWTTAVDKWDYLENNTEYIKENLDDIDTLKLYLITAQQVGTIKVTLKIYNKVTTEKLVLGAVTTEKLASGVVTPEKTSFFELFNLVDPNTLHVGTYNNGWNIYKPNDAYTSTSVIEVKPNTTYYVKAFNNSSDTAAKARFVSLHNSNHNKLRQVDNTDSFTTNDNEVYVFITYHSSASEYFLGTTLPTTFKPFGPKIPGSLIDIDSLVVETNTIADGAVTQEKLAEGVHVDAAPMQFGALVKSEDEIGVNTSITPPFIHCYKNIIIVGEVKSTFEKIAIGLSYMGFYGWWIEITSTDISAHSGSSGTTIWTESHGLNLTTNTIIIISVDNPNGSQFVKITNNEGDVYEKNISFSGQGEPFLRNLNTSNTISAVIKFFPRDITQKIWMFGDSYFTTSSPTRWPYYLFQSGYKSFLMSSQGGDSAIQAIQSFNNLLATGIKPSFAIWYIGMNGGRDASDGPNQNWLSLTNQFLTTCDEYGITPVLVTIPTCPTEIHIKMNAWIKASGRRYIDCAKMVESEIEGNYYWKGWGTDKAMLSSDEVHPTAQGAKALFAGTMIDFPEITMSN